MVFTGVRHQTLRKKQGTEESICLANPASLGASHAFRLCVTTANTFKNESYNMQSYGYVNWVPGLGES